VTILVAALSTCTLAALLIATSPVAQARETITIGNQRSSTLLLLLKRNRTLEQKLDPLGYDVRWHEFSKAAHAPLTYYAEETSVPTAQAIIVVHDSPIRSAKPRRNPNRVRLSHEIVR
jgi:sulfonate transport system substrate-binding protein